VEEVSHQLEPGRKDVMRPEDGSFAGGHSGLHTWENKSADLIGGGGNRKRGMKTKKKKGKAR
jgi:hypothetical protein